MKRSHVFRPLLFVIDFSKVTDLYFHSVAVDTLKYHKKLNHWFLDILLNSIVRLRFYQKIVKGKLSTFKKGILTLKYWSMVSDSKSRPSGIIGTWQINGFEHSMLSKTLTNIEKTWERPPGIKLGT